MWPLSSSCTMTRSRYGCDGLLTPSRSVTVTRTDTRTAGVLGDLVDLLQGRAVDHGLRSWLGVAEDRLEVVDVARLAHHVAQRAAGAVDEPVHAVVDVVLVVAEHVDHGLRRRVDEPLFARLRRLRVPLLRHQQRHHDRERDHQHRGDTERRRWRRAWRSACGAAAGRRAGRPAPCTVAGCSTLTPRAPPADGPGRRSGRPRGPAPPGGSLPRRLGRRAVRSFHPESRRLQPFGCSRSGLPWIHHQVDPRLRGRDLVGTSGEHARSPGGVGEHTGP